MTKNAKRTRTRLSRPFADSIVVEFHQIRQMLTGPTAKVDPTFASTIDAVCKARLKNGLLRLVRNLHDPQRKRVKVQQQNAVSNKPSTRHMAVAEHHATTRVFRSIRPDKFE